MSRETPGQSRHRFIVPAAPMAQDKLDSGRTCDLARHLTIPDARWRRYDSDRIASSVIYLVQSEPHLKSERCNTFDRLVRTQCATRPSSAPIDEPCRNRRAVYAIPANRFHAGR